MNLELRIAIFASVNKIMLLISRTFDAGCIKRY